MKYYKDKDGNVFAYETEEDRKKFGSPTLVEISADEVVRLNSAKPQVDISIIEERLWRDAELVRADTELYKVQDGDPKAVGAVAGWREYRNTLRAWPEHRDFPNKDKRPVSPDA